ncbi:MAG TPA: acetate/propionate family kinase [Eoetvoesiella sp.]
MSSELILVINSGSASLKFGLCTEINGQEHFHLSGLADGIGLRSGKIELRDAQGFILRSGSGVFASQGDALEQATQWLNEFSYNKPTAVGHRVVHGGPALLSHQRITPAVLTQLRACVHFAPLHIPVALELIEKAREAFPDIPHLACFDTVFHSTLPETAARFALPSSLFDEGIRRYGFHGLSYESIVHQLAPSLPGRMVIAHLGNGASLAALKDGRSIDTTMGLTPTGGIPMATRSGDLDPGVILYLLRTKHLTVKNLETLLNENSGLNALSGGTHDMRDLLARANSGDLSAQVAIDIFCTSIRKMIAAYTAVLGGLDMLIFTGGVGEHSAEIRSRICKNLDFLGASVHEPANQRGDKKISTANGQVGIFVVNSQEDLEIARHCRAMLRDLA